MITITLAPETESRLQLEASRHGFKISDYARKLIEESLPKTDLHSTTQQEAALASIEILNKWERDNATDDPEEIARRQIEFEEFKAGMNRNRLEMEGPPPTPMPSM